MTGSAVMDTTWVVLPTYNERDTLAPLVKHIVNFPHLHILVVDDNSPDGTGALADQLRRQWPRLEVLHRPRKTGLGPAYRAGFQFVLDRGAEQIIQMDADGSHDPALLPVLLAALDTSDLVLASRYVTGGSMDIGWRQWISRIGNGYIRFMLGRAVQDWSTGFKAWRGSFLRPLLAEPSRGIGYAWLMEMTWLAAKRGGRIREVPLQFRERQRGQSKFTWRIVLEDIRLAWELRWRR